MDFKIACRVLCTYIRFVVFVGILRVVCELMKVEEYWFGFFEVFVEVVDLSVGKFRYSRGGDRILIGVSEKLLVCLLEYIFNEIMRYTIIEIRLRGLVGWVKLLDGFLCI